jgi:hypothetical protein
MGTQFTHQNQVTDAEKSTELKKKFIEENGDEWKMCKRLIAILEENSVGKPVEIPLHFEI